MTLRRTLTWTARIAGGLVVLIILAYGSVHLLSVQRANASVMVPLHFAAAGELTDAALIAEGERIARVRGCVDCHGANLGGKLFINDPMIGTVYAANLTSGEGGRGAEMTPEDWELAIRHGVRRDGTQLAVMPSPEFSELTDRDVAAIIAYARSVEPVTSEPFPAPKLGPMGHVLHVAGQIPAYPAATMEHHTTHEASITPEISLRFGKYVTHSCAGCHGPNLSGGKIAGAPPSAPIAGNLTPDRATGIGAWSEDDFIRAMREGVRPDGSKLDPFMPVPLMKHMTDTELKAAYLYLRSLPPTPKGARN